MWNPVEHDDQDNLKWAWLRAVEWGSWPAFISQPIVPVALLVWPWPTVVVTVVVLNVFWASLIRYRFVSPALAFWGAFFVQLKWLACPASAALLFARHDLITAAVALLWPIVIMVPGLMLPAQVGRLQTMFMQTMGYELSR